MSDERRQDARVRIPLEMRWESLSGRHTARVYDISMSGCYVETLGEVQQGERLRIEIQSPTGRWLPFKGVVVHRETNMGFGLSLVEVSDPQRATLAELIDYARSISG
jgi:hypothetical protein